MAGEVAFHRYRRIGLLILVTAVHLILLSWALSVRFVPSPVAAPESIDVVFADLEADPVPAPIVPPPPVDPPAPSLERPLPVAQAPAPVIAAPPASEAPGPDLEADVTSEQVAQTPEILTQNEPAPALPRATMAPSTDMSNVINADEIAAVLNLAGCNQLRHKQDESCPPEDPFAAAEASAARALPPDQLRAESTYRSKSVIDKFYEKEVFNRLHWPDPDLFADPMPPGAYDAQRIRNGQEPLWSKKVRDSFRKDE